jgi:hypothetical protein
MPEQQNIEYKSSWHDDYLKWVCGFANAVLQSNPVRDYSSVEKATITTPTACRRYAHIWNMMKNIFLHPLNCNVTFLRNVGLVGVNRFYRTAIPNGMRKPILSNDILKEKN